MRKILIRYFLVELASVFVITLATLTGLFLILGIVQQAYKEGLGVLHVLQLIPYLVPNVLRFALPSTALFSVSVVYGRLAANNEIIAIKSLGINPIHLVIWPALIPAALLSLFTVLVNDVAVSWGRNGVQRVVMGALEEVAYRRLRVEKSYLTSNFSIHVKDVMDRKLIMPTITFMPSRSGEPVTITASEAELTMDAEHQRLTIVMRNGTASAEGGSYHFDYEEQHIPMAHLDESGVPSHMPASEIPSEIARVREEIRVFEEEQAATIAYKLITGDFEDVGSDDFNNNATDRLQIMHERLCRLLLEPWRRWANGFSCFCFVLVGIPIAVQFRNSGYVTSFFYCFLPILIFYYPILLTTVSQAKGGVFPSWSVWAANLLMIPIGIYLNWLTVRY